MTSSLLLLPRMRAFQINPDEQGTKRTHHHQRRTTVAHERQCQTLGGYESHVDGYIDECLQNQPGSQTIGQQAAEQTTFGNRPPCNLESSPQDNGKQGDK